MRKRLWSPDEDEALQKYVSEHGFGNWSEVAKKTGLQRCGKSCRLRWINYLRPDLKRGKFTMEEKMIIVNLQGVLGNSWSKIAAHLPGRTDSDIKNFWHSHFRKKRLQQTNSFLSGTKVPESTYTYNPTAGTDAWNPKYTAAPAFHAWQLPFNRSMNPYDDIQSKELDLQSGQKFPTVSPSSVLTELPSYEIPDRGGLVDPDLISAFCNTNWHDGASSSSTNLNLQKFNRDAEAPLEGLDLVVWSCANRTVPQTEQVAPDQVASWSVLDPQLQNVAYGFSQ